MTEEKVSDRVLVLEEYLLTANSNPITTVTTVNNIDSNIIATTATTVNNIDNNIITTEKSQDENIVDTIDDNKEPSNNNDKVDNDNEDLTNIQSKRKLNDSNKTETKIDQNKKIPLKKRHITSHPSKENRLCLFVLNGDTTCPYDDKCSYSHDLKEYLTNKPIDLGPSCYVYDTFGYCNQGLMCRFASSHIDHEKCMNIKRSDDLGGVKDRIHMNQLSKDIQNLLRKKKYDYWQNKVNNDNKSLQDNPDKNNNSIIINSGSTTIHNNDLTEQSSVDYSLKSYPTKSSKLVDFSNKVYIAPLTTVGNLPFRRILKEYGADITCGEMAMSNNILSGQASEWALLRRHTSEDVFGIQLAGSYADTMKTTSRILNYETQSSFIDLNCGCPIDIVCNKGCGSALMMKPGRLCEVVDVMCKELKTRSVTVKIRTGWTEKNPSAHSLVPYIQKRAKNNLAAIMIHGRSRLQRYSKLANWEYVLQAAQSQDVTIRRIPIIGNGDILSWDDWNMHQHLLEQNMHKIYTTTTQQYNNPTNSYNNTSSTFNSNHNDHNNDHSITSEFITNTMNVIDSNNYENDKELLGLCSCAMLGRGALIKPWLPQEIKEQRIIDISATERLEIIKKFCNYGLEHWGSDQQGVNNTRRFLLEWQSFLHRYVPHGILKQTYPQKMNQRPPLYFGRCDLETILSSNNSNDWIKLSEMFLGNVDKDYTFIPKHKSNSYTNDNNEALPNG